MTWVLIIAPYLLFRSHVICSLALVVSRSSTCTAAVHCVPLSFLRLKTHMLYGLRVHPSPSIVSLKMSFHSAALSTHPYSIRSSCTMIHPFASPVESYSGDSLTIRSLIVLFRHMCASTSVFISAFRNASQI